MRQQHDVTAHIRNTPEAVMAFIADLRNRTRYLPSLKSLTDIQGDPSAAGTTWRWKFAVLGREFEGTGRCLEHEPGRLYSFQTEGGLESVWTYRAEPDGDGTKLSIHVEFQVPDGALGSLLPERDLEAMMRKEGEQVVRNLKAILEQ